MGTRLYTSLQAQINQSAAGTQTFSAVAGKRIVVVSAFMTVGTAGTIQFQSGTTSTITTGATGLAVNTPLVLPYHPDGWFTTAIGESLKIILGGSGATLAGSFNYVTI